MSTSIDFTYLPDLLYYYYNLLIAPLSIGIEAERVTEADMDILTDFIRKHGTLVMRLGGEYRTEIKSMHRDEETTPYSCASRFIMPLLRIAYADTNLAFDPNGKLKDMKKMSEKNLLSIVINKTPANQTRVIASLCNCNNLSLAPIID